jgi:RNA polymerase sigma factor (sigma-70 family)
MYQFTTYVRRTGVSRTGVQVAAETNSEFTAFYRVEHDGQVRRAFLLLGDNDAANDIVHDAMTNLFRRWHTVEQPGAYLNRAVLNGCRDNGRRKNTSVRLLQRIRPGDGDEAPSEPLADVLAKLPFNHRAAIVLRYYSGFTTDEIARALDCAPGSVGPWIERGLAAMRKVLT